MAARCLGKIMRQLKEKRAEERKKLIDGMIISFTA
jgi:hypothetical protein